MKMEPWPSTARLCPESYHFPRLRGCPECAEKDARIWKLETENRRLIAELIDEPVNPIDVAADMAVNEGPER